MGNPRAIQTCLHVDPPSTYCKWTVDLLKGLLWLLLLPTNEVCEGYVFTGVCLSTGGCAWFYSGACMVLFGGCVVLFGGMHGFIGGCGFIRGA